MDYYHYPPSQMSPYYYSYHAVNNNLREEHQEILTAIMDGIKGEATAIDFYTRLAQMAPNETHRQDILHALDDEKVHLKLFTDLYVNLTNQQPVYQIQPTQFNSYKEGLNMAYIMELEAYEDYRNAYLSTQNQSIKNAFFRAFTDEIEHAIRFGFLRFG